MDGNKTGNNNNNFDLMDLDEREQALPEDNGEDAWTDGAEPLQPWKMTLIFAGLVILAAVIVAGLWGFTHRGDSSSPDDTDTDFNVEATNSSAAPTKQQNEENSQQEEQPSEQLPESGGTEENHTDASPSPEAGQAPTPTQSSTEEPKPSSKPDDQPAVQAPQDGDTSMRFDAVQESVTPKDVVNLRSVPSTVDANTIVTQVSNGEVLARIGINGNTGWSQIDYDGQTLYAVTQYLTTDLSYKTPVTPSNPNRVSTISGRVIIFNDCDDYITPKEYVNLRTEPSTTEGDATVSCQVNNGESIHRTGVSPDSGWSRVEYNGQVLYVVTSLMQAVQ